mmetsp:Transcript_30051/g.75498  ORF Transcript_30051/g.75498 Transcript_30051/m.75498 type:complete len:283 (-) Transcript_30051:286-1134(-)
MAAALRSTPITASAPVPSPSRSPSASAGAEQPSATSCAQSRAAPRSADVCEMKQADAASGAMRTAASAAAPAMKPSIMTATRRRAASMIAPASATSSNPPRARSAPEGPSARMSARFVSSACRTNFTFTWRAVSSSPVPEPVASSGPATPPPSAQRIAAAAVELPRPSSPTQMTLHPPSSARRTAAAPSASATVYCACVIAGPLELSAQPRATLATRTRTCATAGTTAVSTASIPTSTSSSVAPLAFARTALAAPPAAIARKIVCVEDRGKAESSGCARREP